MNLPEYEPSDKNWQSIENKLDEENFRSILQDLPQYEPQEKVWKNITSDITNTKFIWMKWMAAASIILIAGIFFIQKNAGVSFTKQSLDPELVLNENDNSEYGYEQIKKICIEDKIVCEKPEFKALEAELDDLNTASKALKEAMGKYNTEPELVVQLAEIENQKSDIIRQMAAQI